MVGCSLDNYACEGGFLISSVEYLLTEGVATDSCVPYVDATTQCSFKCVNESEPFKKYFCKPGSLKVATKTEQIQQELMNHGPMMVGLVVYEDFLSYQSGVYQFTTGELIGGHAMKMIGWGTDDEGYLYWILQNQWSNEWGEQGFVNIKAGEIAIDSMAIACDPEPGNEDEV